MEETKDDASSIEGSIENTSDDAPMVKDATAAADTTTAHGDDDATSNGSTTLLSSPASNADSLVGNNPPPSDNAILDSGASIQYTAAPTPPRTLQLDDLPATAPDGMATLQRAISEHFAELDRQRIWIGEKYDTLHDLLVMAQAKFDASAIERRVRSTVWVQSAGLKELVVNAEAAIDIKYDEITTMHSASKSALSEALSLVDASNLSTCALAAVDNAITTAVAPGGMLAERIGDEVTTAVIAAVDRIVARELNPHIHEVLDDVFTSYQDCVLMERQLAETEVTTFFKAQQGLARTEYTEFLADSTSASIAQLEGALDAGEAKLDATLRSTEQALNRKGESVVEAIDSRLKTTPPTPTPITPPLTSLGTRAENATPVGTSRAAYGNIPCPSTPYTPSPSAPTPSGSPIVDATGDGTHLGGAHPNHLDSPQRGGAPPRDPSMPRFTSAASHVRFGDDSACLGGAQDDYIRPSRYSGTHDGSPRPSPTGYTLRAMSYDAYPARSESSNDYHCG
jgi:hypothetical protein